MTNRRKGLLFLILSGVITAAFAYFFGWAPVAVSGNPVIAENPVVIAPPALPRPHGALYGPPDLRPRIAQPPSARPSLPDLDDPALPQELPGPTPRGPLPEGLLSTTAFGRYVEGLDPELLARIREAEQIMDERAGQTADDLPSGYGVASISGYRPGSRAHSQGRAIDINYYANPYIMHERGEAELDARLAPVYHRIARLMLGRDSVIPEKITLGTRSEERTLRLYDELREESRAMVTYFRLMRDREGLARHLEALRKPVRSEYLDELGSPTAGAIQQRMMADYVTLSGRAGPEVPGLTYPLPDPSLRDPPFAGDPRYRAPELGFLNMPRELVRALTRTGLRWGAVDFGRSSGDVMHFDLGAPRLTPD